MSEARQSVPEKAGKKSKPISRSRAWAYVWIGGALEIVWASGFKYEAVPGWLVIISLLVSFDLIIKATKVIPVGTTYAVFTAIGTVGTVVVDAIFADNFTLIKGFLVLLLLLFVIGLKRTGDEGGRN
ncbi:DMT family transporter [Staphylospora marina]|uniref:DMT family transporter n=1 Tax=Staphylospora marina TaxID=2490858 RepID=UPI000F5BB172|nr:SMR family transporter [Staphylospora marina]